MTAPKPTDTPAEALERAERRRQQELAREAMARLSAGEKPSAKQAAALRAWEQEQLDKWGAKALEQFPKGKLCDLLGVPQKVMLEKSRRFGLSYHTSGKTCRPLDLLAELLAWTTEHRHAIDRVLRSRAVAAAMEEDADELDYWQTELVKARTLDLRDKREERQGATVPREALRGLLDTTHVDPVRKRLERLDRRTGAVPVEEVRGWYEEDLARLEEKIDQLLSDPEGAADEP